MFYLFIFFHSLMPKPLQMCVGRACIQSAACVCRVDAEIYTFNSHTHTHALPRCYRIPRIMRNILHSLIIILLITRQFRSHGRLGQKFCSSSVTNEDEFTPRRRRPLKYDVSRWSKRVKLTRERAYTVVYGSTTVLYYIACNLRKRYYCF